MQLFFSKPPVQVHSMRRFFITPESIQNNRITITGPEAHHISTVLRLQPGEQVEFIDGSGHIYLATLDVTGKKSVRAAVIDKKQVEQESLFPITLAQGVLKGKKMEMVVQKATELGVIHLLPLYTRFCDHKALNDNRHARWQRIMVEACKQSQRPTPMHIAGQTSLEKVDFSPYTHKYIAWEKEGSTLLPLDMCSQPGPICICIGPEGGWHQQEVDTLLDSGFLPFSLGPSILRGETATIAAVAITQYVLAAGHQYASVPSKKR